MCAPARWPCLGAQAPPSWPWRSAASPRRARRGVLRHAPPGGLQGGRLRGAWTPAPCGVQPGVRPSCAQRCGQAPWRLSELWTQAFCWPSRAPGGRNQGYLEFSSARLYRGLLRCTVRAPGARCQPLWRPDLTRQGRVIGTGGAQFGSRCSATTLVVMPPRTLNRAVRRMNRGWSAPASFARISLVTAS